MAGERIEVQYTGDNKALKKAVYEQINEDFCPGDVVFMVSSDSPEKKFPKLRKIRRRLIGMSDNDKTDWHTTMSLGKEKSTKGATIHPMIIHAAYEGVEKTNIRPSYFSSVFGDRSQLSKAFMEIIRFPDLSEKQKQEMTEYSLSKLGQPFQGLGWKHDFLPYAFGIRAPKIKPDHASCHGLVYSAFDTAGIKFPHQLQNTLFFNLGRMLGHVIGEPKESVDVSRLYLHDHNLYQDSRFETVLSIHEDSASQNITIQREGPKYSWDAQLQKDYKII